MVASEQLRCELNGKEYDCKSLRMMKINKSNLGKEGECACSAHATTRSYFQLIPKLPHCASLPFGKMNNKFGRKQSEPSAAADAAAAAITLESGPHL